MEWPMIVYQTLHTVRTEGLIYNVMATTLVGSLALSWEKNSRPISMDRLLWKQPQQQRQHS